MTFQGGLTDPCFPPQALASQDLAGGGGSVSKVLVCCCIKPSGKAGSWTASRPSQSQICRRRYRTRGFPIACSWTAHLPCLVFLRKIPLAAAQLQQNLVVRTETSNFSTERAERRAAQFAEHSTAANAPRGQALFTARLTMAQSTRYCPRNASAKQQFSPGTMRAFGCYQ